MSKKLIEKNYKVKTNKMTLSPKGEDTITENDKEIKNQNDWSNKIVYRTKTQEDY